MPENNFSAAAEKDSDAVYRLSDRILVSEDGQGIITLSDPQDHKIQQFFRRLHVRIPQYRRWTLDDYGSLVVRQLQKGATAQEIAAAVKDRFGAEAEPLFERLVPYLKMLETRKLIVRKASEES